MLYTLSLHSVMYQLYLNKARGWRTLTFTLKKWHYMIYKISLAILIINVKE